MTDSDGAVSAAELIQHARSSIERAYVRYSDFAVAAAVVDEHGRIFTGVNVENVSYGLTICAERVAIFTAIAAGAHRITALAVTAKKLWPVAPCGACRQVMAEFCEAGTPVLLRYRFLKAGRMDGRRATPEGFHFYRCLAERWTFT